MLALLGLIAGSLFAYAGVPAAVRTVRAGKQLGTPLDIIVAIFLGTIIMYSYLTIRNGFDWVLVLNYGIECLSWGVLLYYGIFKR